MLHVRALGTAFRAGATLGRSSGTLAVPAATLAEQVGAAKAGAATGWRRLLEEYGGATSRLTFAGAPSTSDREKHNEAGTGAGSSMALHTASRFMVRQQGSTPNDPDATAKEAGRFTSGGRGGAAMEGSGGYTLLAATHAGLAATCFVAPTTVANLFFPGAALPQGFESQALVKLLGCGSGVGSATSLGLKQLADRGQLASPTAQRLQLGLMSFSSSAIALHAMYSASITGASLLAGATTMGLTFLIPYNVRHYVKTNGGLKLGEAIKSYFGAVPDHFKVSGLQSGLYSLLTPLLVLVGASYLLAPGSTLAEVFGFAKGLDTFFFWQVIGGALMTVAPTVTFSLKKLADEGRLDEPVAKTLNVGVVAAALGHLAVFGPMLAANQGGPALPWVAGAWTTALLTGGLGLVWGGTAKAAA